MTKKAQMSYFIVIGIFLIAAASVFYYLNQPDDVKKELEEAANNAESHPVRIYLEECLSIAARDAAIYFGYFQGIYDQTNFLEAHELRISRFYSKGEDIVPAKKEFEAALEDFFFDQIELQCSDLSLFEEQGYSIQIGSPVPTATITSDTVLLELTMPTVAEKAIKTEFSEFSFELPVRLGAITDFSRELIAAVQERPQSMDLTLFQSTDIDVSVFDHDACNQIYVLSDDQSTLDDGKNPYLLTFGVQFSGEFCLGEVGEVPDLSVTLPENGDPILELIPDLSGEVGSLISYTATATDPDSDTIFYHGSGILKDRIGILNGTISFVPRDSDVGSHEVTLSVIDLKGGIDQQMITLTIE